MRVRSDGSRGSEKTPSATPAQPPAIRCGPDASPETRAAICRHRQRSLGARGRRTIAAPARCRFVGVRPDPMARLSASRPRRNRSEDAPCPSRFPMPNSQIPLASMVKGVLTSLYTRPGCCAAVSQFRFFERMRDCRDRVAIRGKTTIKREDFTTEHSLFSCRPAISNEPDFNRPSKCHLRQVGSVI